MYAEEDKGPVAASRKNTRSMCIKPKSGTTPNVTAQHSPNVGKQAPPRGQRRLGIFASCFHMLAVAHPTCRVSTSLKSSVLSQHGAVPRVHPGETALRWVRCWRAEAPSYIRCAAHKSPDERQYSFCHCRTSTTTQEADSQPAICIVWHGEGVAIPAGDSAADLE